MKRTIILTCLCIGAGLASAEELQDTICMQELTVVATKENAPYRRQPLSVSTLGVQSLRLHQVMSIKNLSCLVPNFYMPDYGSRLTSAIYIRGIGSRIRL